MTAQFGQPITPYVSRRPGWEAHLAPRERGRPQAQATKHAEVACREPGRARTRQQNSPLESHVNFHWLR